MSCVTYGHLWTHHGLVNDRDITLIDKTDSSDPTRRENFWIRLLKTYYPLDPNIKEETKYTMCKQNKCH